MEIVNVSKAATFKTLFFKVIKTHGYYFCGSAF